VLVLVAEAENTVSARKSFSNLPKARCMSAMSVHPYEVLGHEWLLVTEDALSELERRVR
jgi:ribosomal protein L4